MSTTTIRLPEELKARVAKAVKEADTTTHSFILEAIAEKVGKEELRLEFNKTADVRFDGVAESGKTIPWHAMKEYMKQRVAGKKARRPASRKLGR